jgi:Ca2+-binding EF-hand superfamily protein
MKKALILSAILAGTAGVAIAQAPQPTPAPAPVAPMAAHPTMQLPQTRDEVVAKVREHFAQMDVNRDGFVTRDEMQGMRGERRAKRMAMRGAAPDATRGGAFERLDTNRDNMISREEFTSHRAMRAEHAGKRGERMAMRGHGMMMRRADADKDGRVSLAEAQAAAVQHFDKVDINRDGRITPEERQQMRHQRIQQRAARTPKAG